MTTLTSRFTFYVSRFTFHVSRFTPSAFNALALAAILDALVGEPPARLHPVVWMGSAIGTGSRWARTGRPGEELWRGAVVAGGGGAAAAMVGFGLERGFRKTRGGWVLEAGLLSALFAWRALDRAAEHVERHLMSGDLPAARQALRSLVSRDPSALGVGQIAAAACESVAENLVDSLVAPTFAYLTGGLGAVLAYRWLNTADAMIGYRGEWEFAGKVAARLDDLANWIPARIATGLLLLASPGRIRAGWRGVRRDHRQTASPNAGWTMSALAAILNRELVKPGQYALNAGAPLPDQEDIRVARRIVQRAWGLWIMIALAGLYYGSRR